MLRKQEGNLDWRVAEGAFGGWDLRRDRFSFFIFILSLLSTLAQALLILVSWGKLPPQVPLFYSRVWGETFLAPKIGLAILPVIGATTLIFNFLIVFFLTDKNRFLVQILVTFSLLVAVMTLYDTYKIIFLLI